MYKIEDIVNQVHCADCLEFMKNIPDNSIDLVVTSPPYDNLRDYEKYSFDFEGIAKQLFRIMRQGGVCVWVVNDKTENGSESGTSFRHALYFKEIGFNLHDTMIWEKSTIPQETCKRYQPLFEYMFILTKDSPKTFNPIRERKRYTDNRIVKCAHRGKDGEFKMGKPSQKKDKISGNIWYVPSGGGIATQDKKATQHPAIFPEKLAELHISSWSNENDIVLDPFSGSGTTCKMALKANRRFIGIEISEKYCEIARARIKKEQDQLKMF